ncbi:MAG: hypothetical protein ABIZ18_06180 [Caldimonas sp.]
MAALRVRLAHLLNGWLVANSSQPAPSYTRRPDGAVRLGGNLRSGQVGAAAFELPADCRPAEAMQFPTVPQQAQFGSIMITALGQVVPSTGGHNLPLSNVKFQASESAVPES